MTLPLQLAAAMLVRLSLLALYLRIFKAIPLACVTIWVVKAAVSLFYMVCIILFAVKSAPNSRETWQQNSLMNDWGVLARNINIAQASFGIISDLVILAIPLKLVYGLTMTRKRKFGVLTVFLTGLL